MARDGGKHLLQLCDNVLMYNCITRAVLTIGQYLEYRDIMLHKIILFPGVTPESATATVEITVRDVNDIVPTLDRTEYSVAIQENSIPGDIIALVRSYNIIASSELTMIPMLLQVQATDNDAGENGQVLFSFKEGSTSGFMIDELTGEISASVSFDFEQEQSYLLTILAMDNSTSSPLSSTARFIVNITDMNDNAPIFDVFPADRTLSEATAVGTVIASVGASDRDSGDNAAVRVAV